MKKTKIICTIGPACEEPTMLKKLVSAGMDVARLNFAHGDFKEHEKRVNYVKLISEELQKPVAILLDIKGPEIRIGHLKESSYQLIAGKFITLTSDEMIGDSNKLSISYKGLVDDVSKGARILLDDGLIELEVVEVFDTDIKCIVKNDGIITSRKSVNVPGIRVNLPGVTEKDKQHILFGIKHNIDIIAASFVRDPHDILEIREILEENNAGNIQIIAKIENREGLDNLKEILEVADGIMVARGDLGVEIPLEEVPSIQKQMIQTCNQYGKPVITATHMLETMQYNPRPTRAEANDVSNSIIDGTDVVMLSGETAIGKYPVESVQMMARIIEKTERQLNHREMIKRYRSSGEISTAEAISYSAVLNSLNLGAQAIITPTETGFTSRMVSKYRPSAPIIAVSSNESTIKSLSLVWGVIPLLGEKSSDTDELMSSSIRIAKSSGWLRDEDIVIITAGIPVGQGGSTNLIKVDRG